MNINVDHGRMRRFGHMHGMHNGWGSGPFVFIGGAVWAVVIAFLLGYFVMLLWNWLMPMLFSLKTIGYWQAFGIILLARFLVGSFGHGGGGGRQKHFHYHGDEGSEWEDDGKDWGGHSKWKYYGKYWKEEGKEAFDKYVERKEQEKVKKPE
jgi:hypothetical protein